MQLDVSLLFDFRDRYVWTVRDLRNKVTNVDVNVQERFIVPCPRNIIELINVIHCVFYDCKML